MTPAQRLPSHFVAQHITFQCGYGTAIMGARQFKPGDRWHCLGCGTMDEKIVAAKMATLREQNDLMRIEHG